MSQVIDLYICHKLYERVRKARTSREGYAAMHALWPENSALPCSHCSLLLLNRCFVVWSTREEASKSISPLPSCPNSGSYSVCANQREKRFSDWIQVLDGLGTFRSKEVMALLDKKSAWPKSASPHHSTNHWAWSACCQKKCRRCGLGTLSSTTSPVSSLIRSQLSPHIWGWVKTLVPCREPQNSW